MLRRLIKDTLAQWANAAVRGLIYLFRDSLIKRASATPYDHIGTYMERYWLVPYPANKHGGSHTGVGYVSFWKRPIAWLFQHLGIAIRVHCIKESDHDGAYHDHPWNFMSIILDGRYWEHRPTFHQGLFTGNVAERFQAGDVIRRKAGDLHRLELPDDTPVWTLFITGPWAQDWGFVENPGNKIYWRDYLASGKRDASQSIPVEQPVVVNVEVKVTDEATGEFSDIIRRVMTATPAFGRQSWLLAACKECGNLTHASRWEMPKEAALMTKEYGKLEAEGRHPFTTEYKAKGAPFCECDGDKTIAHRVQA